MEYELFEEIALKKSLPKTPFKKGDIGTIVEIENSSSEKIYLKIEFFTILGESMGTHTIPEDYVKELVPNSIPHMREFKKK